MSNYDLVASSEDSLRYWHAKQMQDPVARVAELEAMIMDWTRHQDPWFDYARHEQVNEALRREGMRLWKLSWLPPVCEHEWLIDDEVDEHGVPTGGWVNRCSKCHDVGP